MNARRAPGALRSAAALALLGSLAMVLLISAPADAAPAWVPTTDITPTGADAVEPALAADAAGDAVVAWRASVDAAHNTIEASIRPAGGTFSPPAPLSSTGAGISAPRVAMNAAGDAVVAWRNASGVIEAASRPAGGAFSAAEPLGPAALSGVGPPEVALNSAGAALVVWVSDIGSANSQVKGAFRVAGGPFSAPAGLSAAMAALSEPHAALDGAGDAVVAWNHSGLIEVASGTVGGAFSIVATSPLGGEAADPRVGLDEGGNALVTWKRSKGVPLPVIEAATRPAGGTFAISPLSLADRDSREAELALGPGADAAVIWTAPGRDLIEVVSRHGANPFSAPLALQSLANGVVTAPRVALDAAGDMAAVWRGGIREQFAVEAAVRTAGGSFSAPVRLSAEDQNAGEPRVALDPAGDGVAVWTRSNSSFKILQAALYDATAPELRGLSVPGTGTAGRPLSFAVSPFDAFSGAASVKWDFGDGTSAAGNSATHAFAAPGSYQVTATATDAAGNAASARATVAVAAPRPGRARAARLAKLRGARAILKLSCPSAGPCAGTAKLSAKRGSKRVLLGKRSFRIAAGKSLTLAIRLSPAARSLLAAAGRRGLAARLEGSGVEAGRVLLKG